MHERQAVQELLLREGGFDPAILSDIRRHYSHYPPRGDKKEAAKYVPADMAERMTLIGNRTQVQQRLDEYRSAGVQLPVMSLAALRALYG